MVGAGTLAGVAAVEQELGGSGEAEFGAGQLSDGLTEGGEVRRLLDAGEGEVGVVGTVFRREAQRGKGFVERGGQFEESVGGLDASVEDAGMVRVGIPAEAPDGELKRTRAGHVGQRGLQVV